jgi:hypothetical protein
VPPDYHVPLGMADLYAENDPQIDKAIDVLMGKSEAKAPEGK